MKKGLKLYSTKKSGRFECKGVKRSRATILEAALCVLMNKPIIRIPIYKAIDINMIAPNGIFNLSHSHQCRNKTKCRNKSKNNEVYM